MGIAEEYNIKDVGFNHRKVDVSVELRAVITGYGELEMFFGERYMGCLVDWVEHRTIVENQRCFGGHCGSIWFDRVEDAQCR